MLMKSQLYRWWRWLPNMGHCCDLSSRCGSSTRRLHSHHYHWTILNQEERILHWVMNITTYSNPAMYYAMCIHDLTVAYTSLLNKHLITTTMYACIQLQSIACITEPIIQLSKLNTFLCAGRLQQRPRKNITGWMKGHLLLLISQPQHLLITQRGYQGPRQPTRWSMLSLMMSNNFNQQALYDIANIV